MAPESSLFSFNEPSETTGQSFQRPQALAVWRSTAAPATLVAAGLSPADRTSGSALFHDRRTARWSPPVPLDS